MKRQTRFALGRTQTGPAELLALCEYRPCKGRKPGSAKLGTGLRGAKGEVNTAALFFSENMNLDLRMRFMGA